MIRQARQRVLDQLTLSRHGPKETFAPGGLGEEEWERILAWMDLAGLTLYFQDRLRTGGALEQLPESVQLNLDRRAAGNHLRTAGALDELGTLTAQLREAGVAYAVLKGLALVPAYCPDPRLRTQYDHDILVSPASARRAGAAFRNAGYRQKQASDACIVYDREAAKVRFAETFEALYSPFLRRSIELHLTLWEGAEDKVDMPVGDDFLERAMLHRWNGVAYMALAEEDCLLFQVLHAFRHILRNWCRLSIFLEIAYFLKTRSSDSAFWARYARRVQGAERARQASEVIFTLAGRLFEVETPREIRPQLTTRLSPVLDLWMTTYGLRAALSNFHDDKCVLFLYREFVDDPAAWNLVERRRLLPLRRPHRPPAIVFQRGRSDFGRRWMESVHALRRLWFHLSAGFQYAWQRPQWMMRRGACLAKRGQPLHESQALE